MLARVSPNVLNISLNVKDLGISTAKIAADAITNAKVSFTRFLYPYFVGSIFPSALLHD